MGGGELRLFPDATLRDEPDERRTADMVSVGAPRITMLRLTRQLEDFELRARDGRIGRVTDFYFDDRRWTIRYFAVETGTWLDHREVLVAPAAVHSPEWEQRALPVDLTIEQVRRSPGIDAEEPITREQEVALIQYYNWPMYWGTPGFAEGMMFALPPLPPLTNPGAGGLFADARHGPALDEQHHIRSVCDVRGYHVVANDGEIGHVEDFVIDDATWQIECLTIATRNWWPGQRVLIAPESIYEVGWEEKKVYVDLTRDQIKQSPPYAAEEPIPSQYVDQLHVHYPPHRNAEP